jgi:hypothetical protein
MKSEQALLPLCDKSGALGPRTPTEKGSNFESSKREFEGFLVGVLILFQEYPKVVVVQLSCPPVPTFSSFWAAAPRSTHAHGLARCRQLCLHAAAARKHLVIPALAAPLPQPSRLDEHSRVLSKINGSCAHNGIEGPPIHFQVPFLPAHHSSRLPKQRRLLRTHSIVFPRFFLEFPRIPFKWLCIL